MSRSIWYDDGDLTPLPSSSRRPQHPEKPAHVQPEIHPRQIRILLVEDDLGDKALIESMLLEVEGADFDLVHVDRLAGAMQRLAGDSFHVVLLDLGLPDSRGLDTFTRLFQRVPNVPIVVLTGNDDEELGARAVASGAQDYLVKGTGVRTLVRSIRYSIGRHRSQRRLRRALAEATTSAANLRSLIDQNLDGILVLSLEGRILFANAAAGAILGTPPNGLLGAESGLPLTPGHSEMKLRHRDGRRIPIHLRLMPLQ